MGWRVDKEIRPDGTVHVWPEDEAREHLLHGVQCECEPRLTQFPTSVLVVHNSYDGRELAERAAEIFNNPESVLNA